MTTRLWLGSDGYWRDADAWSPGGVPQSGDTAVVDTGTLHVGGRTLSGITLDLQGSSSADAPTVVMHGLTLASDLWMQGSTQSNGAFGTIEAVGTVTNTGLIDLGGRPLQPGDLALSIESHGRFFNDGTIILSDGSSMTVDGPGGFINNGLVWVAVSNAVFDTDVSGTGTFEVNAYVGGTLTFNDHVAAGVTVDLGSEAQQLVLSAPRFFHGAVDGLGYPNSIDLPTTAVDAYDFNTSNQVLTLSDQGKVVAALELIGISGTQLHVTEQGGGTVITSGYIPPAGAVAASMQHAAAQPVLDLGIHR